MSIDTGSDIRFHDEISSGSLSQVELYHKLMHDNKQLIYEIKIGIISIIGLLVITICIIYIIFQCRRSSAQLYHSYIRNRRPLDKSKHMLEKSDSTESLIKTKTHITINGSHEKEFYV